MASLVFSVLPKAVSRKKPSPFRPNPLPGVPTMPVFASKSSKNSQEVIPSGTFSHIYGEFTPPKTDAGTGRTIHLVQPAIDALKSQAEMTMLGKQHSVEVKQREYGRSTVHKCTFVFSPQVIKQRQFSGPHYKVDSIRESWTSILKRAGLRHRKSYQSRHTYACWSLAAGANPSFIASQMGHTNAQMVFNVYGAWMKDNNHEQIELLNRRLSESVPCMPHKKAG